MSTIIDLIDEAAGWLQNKNTDQWAKPWPDRGARDNRVLRGLQDRCTWMVHDGEAKAVGTITCRRRGSEKLWREDEQSEAAVYVSRLVVARSHAGLGIGRALIDWAGARALRYWNAQWIRIDVWTTNDALRGYYQRCGFRFHRVLDFGEEVPDEERYPSAALFQKPTSEIDAEAAARFAVMPALLRPAAPGYWLPQLRPWPWPEHHARPAPAGLCKAHMSRV